ncbi:replication factor A protein 3 [Microstroma glucosiphilum]|uniref:Replication factor A protein 3 n=1 Tax=Pseudomicrostroma glucosiphilum TaxID=1684307 RepID=A0A316TZM0_9BASI|nr:replication factor A protein 3 [Pseudomicrostroma glucosiphilum]PWN17771.1 replication factor A protein 3 [Pseudomicrostroma glucosiphilum]
MEKPTPFINSSMLPQYRGQIVRIVGKVNKVSGTTLLLQTSDLGHVEVQLNRDTELSSAQYVEVIGKVADSGEVLREFASVDVGDGVDMNLVERVVEISAKVPQLFTGEA